MLARVVMIVMLCLSTALPAAELDVMAVKEKLTAAVRHELQAKQIPALSLALVQGERVIWATGFGESRAKDRRAADEHTIYRVGSVSKLFADLAAMQLVEQGKLDLDAPITRYLPGFNPRDAFEVPTTLRQLMSHRSGLVREPPVGHYFDPTEPTLAATVESLTRTAKVYQPETRAKYSNAAVAVVGQIVEAVSGQPFVAYIEEHILQPLQMQETSFDLTPALREQLADSVMWGVDGREFPSPVFQLGTIPAGNLYSSVTDQAKFLVALLKGGEAPGGRLITAKSLETMWTPQFGAEMPAFGLGFHASKLDDSRKIGHAGAVYGFATQLAALPDEKLGVIAAASKDCVNGTTTRLSDYALRLMRASQRGETLPEYPKSDALPTGLAREMAGRFVCDDAVLDFFDVGDRLFVIRGPYRREVRAQGSTFVFDDPFAYGPEIKRISADQLEIEGAAWNRQSTSLPAPPPERWQGLIGEYGWDHNVLFIYEDRGRLWALIEWFFYYPLTELGPSEFAFPDDSGLYHGEKLLFKRDPSGRATHVVAADVKFVRRNIDLEGARFRVKPLRPVDELRSGALTATPPEQPAGLKPSQLTELAPLDSGLKFDVRYATENNFLGTVFYPAAKAFLQHDAAEALVRVNKALEPHGFGLLIHDGYRPWYVTKMFYDATPEALRHFVANPANGSRHNRGCAVDLTLYDRKTGQPVEMPSTYDEFSPRAYPGYPGGSSRSRWLRELLRRSMEAEGFQVYEFEWWHFDYGRWRDYPVLNVKFDEIK